MAHRPRGNPRAPGGLAARVVVASRNPFLRRCDVASPPQSTRRFWRCRCSYSPIRPIRLPDLRACIGAYVPLVSGVRSHQEQAHTPTTRGQSREHMESARSLCGVLGGAYAGSTQNRLTRDNETVWATPFASLCPATLQAGRDGRRSDQQVRGEWRGRLARRPLGFWPSCEPILAASFPTSGPVTRRGEGERLPSWSSPVRAPTSGLSSESRTAVLPTSVRVHKLRNANPVICLP
jgi:hypothetical protein